MVDLLHPLAQLLVDAARLAVQKLIVVSHAAEVVHQIDAVS